MGFFDMLLNKVGIFLMIGLVIAALCLTQSAAADDLASVTVSDKMSIVELDKLIDDLISSRETARKQEERAEQEEAKNNPPRPKLNE